MTIAANIGDVAILNFDACFPDSVVGFVPDKHIHRDHLYFLLSSMKNEFLQEAPVNTQGNLNINRIGSMKIALPTLHEQVAIVEYLDEAITAISGSVHRTHRQIDLMNEYRTRLIADVVTGQLDVRGTATQLPAAP
jgi:type I restriction enzyme S subunit